jgi:spore protease
LVKNIDEVILMNIEKFQVRTDLAFEAVDLQGASEVINEEITEDKLVIKRTIIPEHVANELGRRAGVYYALDTQAIKTHDHDDLKKCEDALTYIIKEVIKVENINLSHKGLVVGLGNSNVTPDSLGPAVIDNVIVTRHMFILNPEEVSEGISDVSAVAPGVLGNTGIETYDIVEAIINKIKKKLIM